MVPTFFTERLLLRAVERQHEPGYAKHFADYEVIRHLSAVVPWPYPADGTHRFLDAVLPRQGIDRWLWGLFLRDHPDELIGAVDLWTPGRPEHRGFWLGRAFWGNGLMSEAVVPVVDFAFAEAGFRALVLSNAAGNLRSRRIKEKSGAVWLRNEPARFVDPRFTERELWELTPAAWRAARARADGPGNQVLSRPAAPGRACAVRGRGPRP